MKYVLPLAFALCFCADAGTVLFSDFGLSDSFSTAGGSVLQGSNGNTRQSITQAREFTVSGSGDFDVTEIRLAVFVNAGASSFAAGIFTNNGALPGTQIGANYNLTSNTACGPSCYSVVDQTGVTGITLTGGTLYWMVLRPQSLTDSSTNLWRDNNQGSTSLVVASLDGGSHWITENGAQTNAAFAVLGDAATVAAPEPGELILLASGLLAVIGAATRRRRRVSAL